MENTNKLGTDLESIREQIDKLPPDKLLNLALMPGVKERVGATCMLTEKQREADKMLDGPAIHNMLFGGSRSGKTFLITRKIVTRALARTSRHAIMRFRFNHVVTSVGMDTLPKVMELCFPGALEESRMDKSLWVYLLPNGSEIWLGGLDEKERTEKILGQEYASIFLNECSQINWDTRQIAVTRLAQNAGLPLKMYYDCNPPSKRHWTYLLFQDHIDPFRNQPLRKPEMFASMLVNPSDNLENLPEHYIDELEALDARKRNRFLLGLFSDDDETALFDPQMLDKGRLLDRAPPEMQRVVIAVDPSGCKGPDDFRSDEVGIVVAGIGDDGQAYVLEDLSGRHSPEKWKEIIASAYERYGADAVIGEVNFGGDMVRYIVQGTTVKNLPIAFRAITASRGKHVRAEPISVLFSNNRAHLVGRFPELEDQLCAFTVSGYTGRRSPDRADAMIWALTSLFPSVVRSDRRKTSPRILLGYRNVKKGNRYA